MTSSSSNPGWVTLPCCPPPPPPGAHDHGFFITTLFHIFNVLSAPSSLVNLAVIFSEMLAAVTGVIDTELFTLDQLKGGVSNHWLRSGASHHSKLISLSPDLFVYFVFFLVFFLLSTIKQPNLEAIACCVDVYVGFTHCWIWEHQPMFRARLQFWLAPSLMHKLYCLFCLNS